jgi:hypothetical protein
MSESGSFTSSGGDNQDWETVASFSEDDEEDADSREGYDSLHPMTFKDKHDGTFHPIVEVLIRPIDFDVRLLGPVLAFTSVTDEICIYVKDLKPNLARSLKSLKSTILEAMESSETGISLKSIMFPRHGGFGMELGSFALLLYAQLARQKCPSLTSRPIRSIDD